MKSKLLLETTRFQVLEYETPCSDGSVRHRQVVDHPGAAVILPVLETPGEPQNRSVVLIRNYRVAVGQTLIELPAGTLEPPEPPLETARRELTEETGYKAGSLTELTGFWMSPGILNERMHCFLARDLVAGPPQREAGEEIENLVIPFAEAIELVRKGEIQDAKSVAALLYYQTFST